MTPRELAIWIQKVLIDESYRDENIGTGKMPFTMDTLWLPEENPLEETQELLRLYTSGDDAEYDIVITRRR